MNVGPEKVVPICKKKIEKVCIVALSERKSQAACLNYL